ncbi:uncharacterized protein [Epargyreus clarus]|uniref:uncharacterized protein n=1 Tax=Epargyreus clarus TaxID=520877 RepID=UPI003C2CF0B6
MNNANNLAGLVANYGDSEDESDSGEVRHAAPPVNDMTQLHAPIHPAPVPQCPWSACYDESSGFTYYWNQLTNAVTWEAPPEYLLALKLAQQQLNTVSKATAEVSAEEWNLYQQALIEKQVKLSQMTTTAVTKNENVPPARDTNQSGKKRLASVDEEKIELITSYHNSDSESNDESDISLKAKETQSTLTPISKPTKNPHKKQKTKVIEYGPPLPPNQDYTEPIGPELPPMLVEEHPKSPEVKDENNVLTEDEDKKSSKVSENDDSQDENVLFQRLKDKAKLLEKLGGELPTELQKIIEEDDNSRSTSPKSQESRIQHNLDIDDLLEEIEKKELPKIKSKKSEKDSKSQRSNSSSVANSPLYSGEITPPLEEIKPLFPSSKTITEDSTALFPSAVNIEDKVGSPAPMEVDTKDKKVTNVYLNNTEGIENTNRKKLRISNSVLPERKTGQKFDATAYTTKYAQYMEGFSGERVGLGFTKDENDETSPKNTISYGNGLTFTKGEILNEDKKDEDLDDLADLVEAKLKYLNQLQPCILTPVQEMLIQLQTLVAAFRAGALSAAYWRRWCAAAARALRAHEAAAAPPGWSCAFLRSEGRYRYRREADGLEQWEYPAVTNTDMDISTTPPHAGVEHKEEQPPLPAVAPPAAPPLPAAPPPAWPRAATPPPPAWRDPPPPGIDEPPPLPAEPKKEIGDELLSFYNDIAELEKQTSTPPTEANSPEPPPPPIITEKERTREKEKDRERERDRDKRERSKEKDLKVNKKKSKVKISSSIGMKHKSVSSMVAKWQQVASEIDSD